MKSLLTIRVLNQLLGCLCRSLPAYLADARPWAQSGDQQLHAAIDRLVADQDRYAKRVGEAIVELGGRPDPGSFPKGFAAKNDLSLTFLRQEVLDRQEQDIATIEACAAELEGDAALHALAEEILGNAKGHRDILKEMIGAE
jgi:bacterioferritin (cytochrome b1)